MWRAIVVLLAALATLSVLGSSAAISQVGRAKDLDRQHSEILKDFATRAHKLALQYQQAGSYDKAKETLDLILKVAPDDAPAKTLLEKISRQELSENKKVVKVMANQSWQNTGLAVQEGKPVAIEVKGEWVFKMTRTVGPEGLAMPDEMKRFPLGALIGVIAGDDGGGAAAKKNAKQQERDLNRPFLVGDEKVFTPNATGVLFLKIHDTEENDNQGQLTVTISGQVREL